jgi:hypothetical protein
MWVSSKAGFVEITPDRVTWSAVRWLMEWMVRCSLTQCHLSGQPTVRPRGCLLPDTARSMGRHRARTPGSLQGSNNALSVGYPTH